jgi:hypothetical protein
MVQSTLPPPDNYGLGKRSSAPSSIPVWICVAANGSAQQWGNPQFGRILDLTVSILTAVAAIAIVWVVVAGSPGRQSLPWKARSQKPPAGYLRSDKMDPIAGVNFAEADRTLIVFFRSPCQFCIQSVPYYQRLTALKKDRKSRLQIVAVANDTDADAKNFPDEQGWQPDRVVLVPAGSIKARGVPVLLLVSSSGRVVESWLGGTTAESYDDLVRTVF